MSERETSESTWQDAVGLVGVALGVAGLWDIPMTVRLLSLLGSVACLLTSFINQGNWPAWMRWLLSIMAFTVIALLCHSVITNP